MLLYLFFTALTLLLTKWYFERKKRFQILSNYGYNVPPTNYIAGNLHQIARDDLATMEDWMERYGEEIGEKGGKIMGWYRGPNPALWTTSPELLKVRHLIQGYSKLERESRMSISYLDLMSKRMLSATPTHIWVISPSHSKNMLVLVKIAILPSLSFFIQ